VSHRSLTLLAVFAHPDDETFRPGGTLALLARQGVQVHLLTATRGEAGSCGDPPVCLSEQLGAVRERELRCACATLGINPPRLLDYRDGTLAEVDEEKTVGQVVAAIQELRPQVLLTWPPDGLYGHLDHIAVSRWTALAFRRVVASARDAPVALYHLAVPRSVAQALGLANLHAVPDEEITVAVDVTAAWEQKAAAIRCHRTQASSSPMLGTSEGQQRLFLGREHFQRAQARVEEDLFMVTISLLKGDNR